MFFIYDIGVHTSYDRAVNINLNTFLGIEQHYAYRNIFDIKITQINILCT